MSSEEGEVYIMSDVGDEEWVSPTPARTVIMDAVTSATDLEATDLEDLEEYVDVEALREVLDGDDEELTFTVEDHEVVVTGDGDIDVD